MVQYTEKLCSTVYRKKHIEVSNLFIKSGLNNFYPSMRDTYYSAFDMKQNG